MKKLLAIALAALAFNAFAGAPPKAADKAAKKTETTEVKAEEKKTEAKAEEKKTEVKAEEKKTEAKAEEMKKEEPKKEKAAPKK